ncbi:hypothetical protein [Chryseolinea sp. H1M3-3]|uniref:hypothetical protein n=1 Tax=Chryseolinea sp. H1M3-3 TaxID=3034144 RepID=UPI0023EACE43|nr:hypothetical protein [Chryseolinea sp. H1M3-3]
MKWVVLEENPKPDNYIAVVLTDTTKKVQIESRAHSVYDDGDEALARARQLRDQFGVHMIRIFRSESYSIPMRS